jgi:uncharacterized membrane protein YgcG
MKYRYRSIMVLVFAFGLLGCRYGAVATSYATPIQGAAAVISPPVITETRPVVAATEVRPGYNYRRFGLATVVLLTVAAIFKFPRRKSKRNRTALLLPVEAAQFTYMPLDKSTRESAKWATAARKRRMRQKLESDTASSFFTWSFSTSDSSTSGFESSDDESSDDESSDDESCCGSSGDEGSSDGGGSNSDD